MNTIDQQIIFRSYDLQLLRLRKKLSKTPKSTKSKMCEIPKLFKPRKES